MYSYDANPTISSIEGKIQIEPVIELMGQMVKVTIIHKKLSPYDDCTIYGVLESVISEPNLSYGGEPIHLQKLLLSGTWHSVYASSEVYFYVNELGRNKK